MPPTDIRPDITDHARGAEGKARGIKIKMMNRATIIRQLIILRLIPN